MFYQKRKFLFQLFQLFVVLGPSWSSPPVLFPRHSNVELINQQQEKTSTSDQLPQMAKDEVIKKPMETTIPTVEKKTKERRKIKREEEAEKRCKCGYFVVNGICSTGCPHKEGTQISTIIGDRSNDLIRSRNTDNAAARMPSAAVQQQQQLGPVPLHRNIPQDTLVPIPHRAPPHRAPPIPHTTDIPQQYGRLQPAAGITDAIGRGIPAGGSDHLMALVDHPGEQQPIPYLLDTSAHYLPAAAEKPPMSQETVQNSIVENPLFVPTPYRAPPIPHINIPQQYGRLQPAAGTTDVSGTTDAGGSDHLMALVGHPAILDTSAHYLPAVAAADGPITSGHHGKGSSVMTTTRRRSNTLCECGKGVRSSNCLCKKSIPVIVIDDDDSDDDNAGNDGKGNIGGSKAGVTGASGGSKRQKTDGGFEPTGQSGTGGSWVGFHGIFGNVAVAAGTPETHRSDIVRSFETGTAGSEPLKCKCGDPMYSERFCQDCITYMMDPNGNILW